MQTSLVKCLSRLGQLHLKQTTQASIWVLTRLEYGALCPGCSRSFSIGTHFHQVKSSTRNIGKWRNSSISRFLSSVNEEKGSDEGEKKTKKGLLDGNLKESPAVRKKIDYSLSYTANVFIIPNRAMQEYLLDSGDLQEIEKFKRRSPYPEAEDITVYRRADIEKKAIEVWGSVQTLQAERNRRKLYSRHRQPEDKEKNRYIGETTNKPLHLDYMNYAYESPNKFISWPEEHKLFKTGSGKVVLWAIAGNALLAVCKLVAWYMTNSPSMFAEFIHSVADTANQGILALGLHHSLKKPDPLHPYGWVTIRNVSSLISGVGIFCVGAGLSWYHGVMGLFESETLITSYPAALIVLAGAFAIDGGTAVYAFSQVRAGAKKANMGFREYLETGNDPSTSVVLLEDAAAVCGVLVAGTAMTLSYFTQNYIYDACGSLVIGTILAAVAGFIIRSNTVALVGKSIAPEKRMELTKELESDRLVRALHDVKATSIGGEYVRFKAEVDFDGREVARCYLEKHDLEIMFKEARELKTTEEFEAFMLKHGDGMVDTLGGEVDRIEKKFKKKHPEVRHVDLEQL